MNQAIAGVSPPGVSEATIMTVWPTLAATGPGRFLGRLYGIPVGIGWLTVGNVIALMSIPMALGLFFWMLLPGAAMRYRLTNRRVLIEKCRALPWAKTAWVAQRYVDLARFDSIEVDVRGGQQWYPAGDLIFRNGQIETFRLEGVSRPETFKRTCLKARHGYVGVSDAVARV